MYVYQDIYVILFEYGSSA